MAAEPGLAAAATRAGLGCPNGPAFTSGASEQPFEAGAMLWLEEWGLVLVLTQDGTYRAYEDFFEEGEAEPAPLRPPGTGLEEPRRGFGKVWRRIGGPDAAVGWAVGPEQGSPAEVQYFERGAVLRLGGRILGLAIFSHSSGTWSTGPRSELTLGLLGALSGRPEFAR